MRKLFGTDGIRGEAGTPPLDRATLYRLGRALVAEQGAAAGTRRFCIGRDTRESGTWIERALARGVRDAGGEPVSAGVLPTPALALLTREGDFAAGLMVSASHNPFRDNGVKVFDEHGAKLPDETEAAIERRMDEEPEASPDTDKDGETDARDSLQGAYLEFLERSCEGTRLEKMKIVLDTAHGAAYRLAPEAFRRAGAEVVVLGDQPDGRNINEGVGSMHPEVVAEAVRAHGADLGFAFDGDADRCIGASRAGRPLDGDFALYYAGTALDGEDRLAGRTVVSTVMSNLGLEKALEAEGLTLLRTKVGDRYVLEAMREGGYVLGGEQSGHVIFLDHAPTGDGTLTALLTACLYAAGRDDPEVVLERIPRFPQVLRSFLVREKPAIEEHPALSEAVRAAEDAMGDDGRVVVRYSGTEAKARIMVEGRDRGLVEHLVENLVGVFRETIGR